MQSLVSVDLEDLPVLVKFLLQSVTGQDDLQVDIKTAFFVPAKGGGI